MNEIHDAQVTSDEMLEPFASVAYLRRQHTSTDHATGTVYLREAGGTSPRSAACDNQLLSILEQALGTTTLSMVQ